MKPQNPKHKYSDVSFESYLTKEFGLTECQYEPKLTKKILKKNERDSKRVQDKRNKKISRTRKRNSKSK